MLVSERIGQLFIEGDRVEYTEYGAGDRWVLLVHAPLVPRRMHQQLARTLASRGLHVVALDLLGHGRSDRPADRHVYSVARFGAQVLALLDHLGAEEAVVGGTSLGADVALEVAVTAPTRVRGLMLEMPVLEDGLAAGLALSAPVLATARYLPWVVSGARKVSKAVPRGIVPFWLGIALDTCNQRPRPLAAAIEGFLFGRVAPESRERSLIEVPALVIGHVADPFHPFSDAERLASELPRARLVRAHGPWEWRLSPERLDSEAVELALECWDPPRAGDSERRTGR